MSTPLPSNQRCAGSPRDFPNHSLLLSGSRASRCPFFCFGFVVVVVCFSPTNVFTFLLSQCELEKQRQLAHNRHQITMATQHYVTTLLAKFGLLPWRRLVEITHENMSRATLHHNRVLLSCCFYPWLEHTRKMKEERERAAQSLYNRILLRRTWKQWRKVSPT